MTALWQHPLYREDVRWVLADTDAARVSGHAVLVTGATGLVGAFLANVLIEAGARVWLLARDEAALRARFGYAGDQVRFLAQDVTQPLGLSVPMDMIIHAASPADPVQYARYPMQAITANVLGLSRVLESVAAQAHPARVLFTSSMEVYGTPCTLQGNEPTPWREDMYGLIDFHQVRSGYPESKRAAELLGRSAHAQEGIDVRIARLGYLYGPSMRPGDSKAVAQFLRNAMRGEDIVLKSEGLPIRSYCYVADAVAGMLRVLLDGAAGEAYNVADAASVVSIRELAGVIAGAAGRHVVMDVPEDEERRGFSSPQHAVLDTSKLMALGWQARVPLEAGVRRTLDVLRGSEAKR